MNQLRSIRALLKVVDEGSFVGAARAMDMAASATTRLVVDLEEHLKVRLLNRTTRRIALTPAGIEYVQRMRSIIGEIDAADDDLTSRANAPGGSIKISCTPNFAKNALISEIPGFRAKYPNIDIELGLLASVDVPDQTADVSILIDRGKPLDGLFVAQKIAVTKLMFCASAKYIASHPPIVHPKQLDQLECFIPELGGEQIELQMRKTVGGRSQTHLFRPRKCSIRSSDPELLVGAATQGLGVVGGLSFGSHSLLESGMLVRVLPDWETETWNVYATLHGRAHVPHSARMFIQFLFERFGSGLQDPWDHSAAKPTPTPKALSPTPRARRK